MRNVAVFFQFRILGLAVLIFAATAGELAAEVAAETGAVKPPSVDQMAQADLLKSYLQVRDQLQATQLAVINSRMETESAARAQTAAIAEKFEGLKAALSAEREQHQLEQQRFNQERERQQAETERSNHMVFWMAVILGGLGLIAMLLMPVFQWRAINRMAELVALRPAPHANGSNGFLTAGDPPALADHAVTHSNQRLMSAIDRIERKISDVELAAAQTIVRPIPAPALNGHEVNRPTATAPIADAQSRITLLLGRGRSLFNTNKVLEALACYDEILKIDLHHPEALVRKGAALERLKQDAEAIQCYDRAIAADPKMTLAFLHKGGVCNRLERYEEALECYERALRAEEYA